MGIDLFEINEYDFENSKIKNKFIRSSNAEWFGFADSSVTSQEEIAQIIDDAPFLTEYDAIVFASGSVDGEAGVLELLGYPQSVIYGFCVRRNVLLKTGSFNELLIGNTNYEFLLRVAEAGKLYVVSSDAAKEAIWNVETMAYIVRRYMGDLKFIGMLDEVFLHFVKTAESVTALEEFNRKLGMLLADPTEYEKIEADTAPFFVLVGGDTCVGVLAGFAKSLADELVSLGQAVISSDGKYGDYNTVSTQVLLKRNYKAIIGIQAKALENDVFKAVKGKKVQFWLDDPAFFVAFFSNHSKDTYVLCQDANYAKYIREYYGIPNALHFPPGGKVVENLPSEKIYDVVFVGSYEPIIDKPFEDVTWREFYEYMLQCPNSTFEQGMRAYNRMKGTVCSDEEIVQILFEMKDVCQAVKNFDRHKVVEKILVAGIKLHVFSDSWNMYNGAGKDNLIIHPTVYDEEPFRVWSQAKIGLNIMRGHKAGMTERIANIMLCGTCCVSDDTTYLTENFADGEEIVLFKRTELNELPVKIKYFLSHDEEREWIAVNGRKKAMEEHTWRRRAEELLTLLSAND